MKNGSRSQVETELGDFLRALWRRRWGIVAGTVAAALAATLGWFVVPKQYRATARLVIAEFHMDESVTGDSGRETFAALVSMRDSYATLAQSPTIAQRILEEYELGETLGMTSAGLLEKVGVALIANTAIVQLTVELPDPQLALDVCNAFAEQAVELSREINVADRRRVKEVLTAQLDRVEADLDRLQAEIDELLNAQRDEAGTSGPGTQARMAVQSPLLQRLQSEFETSLRIRADIAQRLEGSDITVASQIGELILVDAPVLPEDPAGPGALLVIGGASVLGLMLAILLTGIAAGIKVTRRLGPD